MTDKSFQFSQGKHQQIVKNLPNPSFKEKSLKMGTFPSKNDPQKLVLVLRLASGTPPSMVQLKSEYRVPSHGLQIAEDNLRTLLDNWKIPKVQVAWK